MSDDPYSKREIDQITATITEKVENVQNVLELKISENHKATVDSLSRIETQVAYTNGKVKKITLALVLLAGVCIGLGFQQLAPFLSLLIS